MDYSDISDIEQRSPLAAMISAFREAKTFLLTSHLRSDGDAVGSLSGLARALRKDGRKVEISLADPVPERFAFVLDGELIKKPNQVELNHDLIVVLDSGNIERTGMNFDATDSVIVNIDHHASNEFFGEINYVDIESSSTCEMVVSLLECTNLPFDKEVAEGLYLGLLTDSRFFQNENLRPSAHRAAETLLLTGLDTSRILSSLNSSRTPQEVKLLGVALQKISYCYDGRLAWMALSSQELSSCEASFQTAFSCGIFNQMTSIKGVALSVGLVENTEGRIFCEFRSKGGIDVKSVAVNFGGGGHLAASGCNIEGPLEQAVETVLIRLKEVLEV